MKCMYDIYIYTPLTCIIKMTLRCHRPHRVSFSSVGSAAVMMPSLVTMPMVHWLIFPSTQAQHFAKFHHPAISRKVPCIFGR